MAAQPNWMQRAQNHWFRARQTWQHVSRKTVSCSTACPWLRYRRPLGRELPWRPGLMPRMSRSALNSHGISCCAISIPAWKKSSAALIWHWPPTGRKSTPPRISRNKLTVIIGTQGSAMVDLEFHRLRTMHRLGMRYFGLAYTGPTMFADGCGESRNGFELRRNRADRRPATISAILDLSTSDTVHGKKRWRSRFPVCTTPNSYALNPNDRNTTDETARAIRAKGGIMGICGLPKTVHPENATLNELLDHADHWVKTIDAAHVGFGLDFVEAYKSDRSTMPAASRLWRTRRPDIFRHRRGIPSSGLSARHRQHQTTAEPDARPVRSGLCRERGGRHHRR